jgi:predicted nucleic acid-binding protein
MPEATPRIVHFDANVFVYAMEKDNDDALLARRWLLQVERGEITAITSELTFAEVLPYPIAQDNQRLRAGYARLLRERPSMKIRSVSMPVLLKAAELRARMRIELADAIHVATALECECYGFLTNDRRLKIVEPLRKLTLSDAKYPL